MIEIESLEIPDVKLIKTKTFFDSRGSFKQTYHAEEYKNFGISAEFIQDNHSLSNKNVLRGLHYQLNHPQAKLVQVNKGKVYDVAVDMRKNSPSFKKWIGVFLSEENGYQLFIPRGFAHGFLALEQDTQFSYKCDNVYVKNDEYGLRWDDPSINIEWPSTLTLEISEKDKALPLFDNAITFS